jgi:peptidoglycan hydrolase-like protein with peptidoglycan-binding domain
MLDRDAFPLPVDGLFGPETEAAVKKFQAVMGIGVANGVVGADTFRTIMAKGVGAPTVTTSVLKTALKAPVQTAAPAVSTRQPQSSSPTSDAPAAVVPSSTPKPAKGFWTQELWSGGPQRWQGAVGVLSLTSVVAGVALLAKGIGRAIPARS